MSAGTAGTHGRIVVVGSLNADLTIYCERLPLPGRRSTAPGSPSTRAARAPTRPWPPACWAGTSALSAPWGTTPTARCCCPPPQEPAWTCRTCGPPSPPPREWPSSPWTRDGENNIIISAGANGTLAPADVAAAADAFDGAAVVCLCLEVSLETVEAAARKGHDAGATVLLNLSPYGEIPQSLADLTDVLLVNAHEASLFLGSGGAGSGPRCRAPKRTTPPGTQSAQRFAERGLQRVLVTLGANGSVVLDSQAAGAGPRHPDRARQGQCRGHHRRGRRVHRCRGRTARRR